MIVVMFLPRQNKWAIRWTTTDFATIACVQSLWLLVDYYGGYSASANEKPYVVVVGLAERRLGLLVDDLLGQEEVVIKSLGDYLGSTPGIAGATIMGDGRIRLIIDIAGLFNLVKAS